MIRTASLRPWDLRTKTQVRMQDSTDHDNIFESGIDWNEELAKLKEASSKPTTVEDDDVPSADRDLGRGSSADKKPEPKPKPKTGAR